MALEPKKNKMKILRNLYRYLQLHWYLNSSKVCEQFRGFDGPFNQTYSNVPFA